MTRYQPPLLDQPSARPMRKVQAAGLLGPPTAAALATVVVTFLELEPTEELFTVLIALFSALGSAWAAGIAYFVRNRAPEL